MFTLRKSNRKRSSRKQIAIKGVRDSILELPGNSYRMILSVSSINFELKSEAEQDALIETYQSFLNSLGSDIQIILRIRELDMDKYLHEFTDRIQSEKTTIYKQQLKNYTTFVRSLIRANKILTRQFYVVIPCSGSGDFDTIREELTLSADIVTKGLARMGMSARVLSSLEVLDLFYSFYNPGQAKRQPITDQTMELLQRNYL